MSGFGTTGSIFGQQATGGSQSNSGVFGSQPNQGAGSSFTFGNSTQPQQTSSGLFGTSNTAQKPLLFGQNAAGSSNTGSNLFANSNNATNTTANSQNSGAFGMPQNQNQTSTKPLFGGFGNSTNTTANTGATANSGLFSNTSNNTTNNIFNKPVFGSTVSNPNGSAAGGSGLFGAPPTNSLFGVQNQQQPQQQGMVASVDQASFILNGVSPSRKLYSSLSSPATKRSAQETDAYQFDSKPPVNRNRIAKPNQNRSRLKPGLPQGTSLSLSGPITKANQLTPQGSQEPRKWINSYEAFVREKPTTLVIRHNGRVHPPKLLPGPDAPVSSAPPIANAPLPISTNEHSTVHPDTQQIDHDVSLFHRHSNNMVFIQVNPEAIEQGYYIYPKLETLTSMSRSQLTQVRNLVIGREKYGKIEYPTPVDLSHLVNLGDLLGKLVIFNSGTVCVYPDESSKAPQGRELNLPATVSIENAWPRDAETGDVITNMDDRRMVKHIMKLKKLCEGRGAEFVTFTNGIWVFKVPHFSTWGLPLDKMVVDDDINDIGDANEPLRTHMTADPVVVMRDQSIEPQIASSPILDALNDDSTQPSDLDIVEDNLSIEFSPQTWVEQLYHAASGVFQAAATSLAAASKPTADLELSEILVPDAPVRAPQEKIDATQSKAAHHNSLGSLSGPEISLKLSELRNNVTNKTRVNSDLPFLQCSITFDQVKLIEPQNKQLWTLLPILYNPSGQFFSLISEWLEQKVNEDPLQTSSIDNFDTIWQLLTHHKITEAAEQAKITKNPHLALLISMLHSPELKMHIAESASKQLENWKTSKTTQNIPTGIRLIWQLAAGQVPSGVIDSWPKLIGIHVWYNSQPDIKSVVASLPYSLSGTSSIELAFLQSFFGVKQLRTAIYELDLFQSFLCLQALAQLNPGIVHEDIKLYDTICRKMAELLEADSEYSSAVFVALHINDTKLAIPTVRKILHSMPASVALPTEYGLHDSVLHEALAHQKAQLGQYQSQCEHLVSAGMYNEAHKVFISNVGPQVVIHNKCSQVIDMLKVLEKHKSDIKHWVSGGEVYLNYAEAVSNAHNEINSDVIISLCNACRYAETPNLESREAISIIAEWVANTPYAQKHIDSDVILKMKFAPSQAHIQTLQQAAKLLM